MHSDLNKQNKEFGGEKQTNKQTCFEQQETTFWQRSRARASCAALYCCAWCCSECRGNLEDMGCVLLMPAVERNLGVLSVCQQMPWQAGARCSHMCSGNHRQRVGTPGGKKTHKTN